jgi:hypothetical protein
MLGLPNATSVQQEMGALYGRFKSSTYACGEKSVQQKLRVRGFARRNGDKNLPPAVLSLDFGDLATIVNGRPDDEDRDRPFDSHFTKAKILWPWTKIGFVPFTRNCLTNKRVRKELGQQKEDETLENLHYQYDVLVDAIEGSGFNGEIFDAVIPTAARVNRAQSEEAQMEEILKAGKKFPPPGNGTFASQEFVMQASH